MSNPPRIIITSGEPAGIGPDLCVLLARQNIAARLVVAADPGLLRARARQLNVTLNIETVNTLNSELPVQQVGSLRVYPLPVAQPVVAGQLDPDNAPYVIRMLDLATQACARQQFDAMVTAPVHKGIINDAGIPFTGHTEYLAKLTHTPLPVMMLQTEGLRVALVTTHVPLRDVASCITAQRLRQTITILRHDLMTKYGIATPLIYVCGLNPHAGEGGHLGSEEQEVIAPVLEQLRAEGFHLAGPLAADTIFSPHNLQQADAFLAMYHDQGLPVLKFKGFGAAINVTLGLPIIRTSVDHGTALTLAGTGKADSGSFLLAIESARQLALTQKHCNV